MFMCLNSLDVLLNAAPLLTFCVTLGLALKKKKKKKTDS